MTKIIPYKVDQELIGQITVQINWSRRQERARQATALYEFLEKMDRLEEEALAEISAMVSIAKHKASGITEKLYGPDNGIIERMLGTK